MDMDRRIQKTRQAIFNAFEELLAGKRYEQITVQDIIEKANIGRSTFYAHFETKDELLKAVCQELFSHVFENHPAAELSHDFSCESNTLRNLLTHILYHLKDDRSRYMRIFSCESAELFWTCFKTSFSELVRNYSLPEIASPRKIPEEFYMNYYCSAFIESVKWWFRSGLQVTPEVLESYFETVTNGC